MDPVPDISADATVSRLPLFPGEPHPCSYIPNRTAQTEFSLPGVTSHVGIEPPLSADAYQALMDAGFRRSGVAVYRMVCASCRECVPIRVPIATFQASRSQRRVWRRNQDIEVTLAEPSPTDEKFRIYAAYHRDHHQSDEPATREDFESFLYRSPVESLEMVYRLAGQIVGVGIVDVASESLSSVYFYFDPTHARRSLGTFSALMEIETCRQMGKPHWYIGYYIRECNRMNYKATFRPCELLGKDGRWRMQK